MRRMRKSLTPEDVAERSEIIRYKLLGKSQMREAKTVMMYVSAYKEPETLPIIEVLLSEGKQVVLPISVTSTNTIIPTYIDNTDELKPGAYGILEPTIVRPVDVSDIDVVVVPGIAFDMHRNRLGFGKGYYDRFLSECDAYRIALCYDFQIVSDLPMTDNDIPMDMVLTEVGEV